MLPTVLSSAALIIGATWALRAKLDSITLKLVEALSAHAMEDEKRHSDHEARIIKLEGRRPGKRKI